MIKVEDIMTKKQDLITVSPDTEIAKAAKIMVEKGINGLPVVDEKGNLVGIICQSDVVTQQKRLPLPSFFTILDSLIPLKSMKQVEKEIEKITATTVGQAMTPHPVTAEPDMGIDQVASLMADKKFHTIPVVSSGTLVGIIGKEDVLKTLASGSPE